MWLNALRDFRNRRTSWRHRSLPDLSKSQYWSLAELNQFQNARLKVLLHYAYNCIPAYRRKFTEAGITPNDIQTKEELVKLPVTTREEMQSNSDFVNARRIVATLYTGGSTGAPLKYYNSELSNEMQSRAHLRGWAWNGYTPGKKMAVISSAQGHVEADEMLHLAGDFTDESLESNVAALIEFKPQHLRGYVSSLYLLALYLLDNDIQIQSIESVDPISENLYDWQRQAMENAFKCKVFEEYCCNDGGACAWECEQHEGLHHVAERAIIEDVDGDLITTDLWNYAMPFIRYENGDSVTFLHRKCSCGRELPLIKVNGITNDIIMTPSGPLSPVFFLFYAVPNGPFFPSGLRAAQYIQKPGYVLDVNVVKHKWCTPSEISAFEQRIRDIAPGMTIKINVVDTLPTTRAGKRNFIVNEDRKLLDDLIGSESKQNAAF